MLTEKELSGLKDILKTIKDVDLFSILETTSKRMIVAQDREGAIKSILSCTIQPSDLLRRQKVTKKILFNYLRNIKPHVNPNAGKGALVKMCLEEWHSKEIYKESDYEDAEMVYDTNEMDAQQPSKTSLMNAMGREFSKWFFSVYNNIKEFGPEHFWPDCFFKAEVKSPWDHKEVMLSGANDVVIFLSNLILIDKLFFHANVSEDSIICEQEQHGLVKIIVSGVLHRSSDCVGLFDSAFGLVRNPTLDDNWKIKWVYMKLCINTSTKDGLAPEACFPSLCQPV
ncbi:uncharacterized protein C3orf38 homolog isoform X2 [Stegodyphus dumicola]|uniref:uncharacterized protein C3orf38 homolog isoform X2 n=1 Tax=Stegodyphus dumicola TaxID=202533 RepID=UPI0015B20A00|nr:uncharacterized protein C3orf38 homolog isoform X2 [Stegodyphus dumicola]